MSNYTGTRLSALENDVSGDSAITTEIRNGWTLRTFINGSKEATVTLDYNVTQTDTNYNIDSSSWKLSETMPSDFFTEYPIVDAQCIDISTNNTNHNGMICARVSLPSETYTGDFWFQPLNVNWGASGYTIPNKLQICWVARGF